MRGCKGSSMRSCEGSGWNGLFYPNDRNSSLSRYGKDFKTPRSASIFHLNGLVLHTKPTQRRVADPPHMRVSRSSVELLGTPQSGRGLPVHRHNSRLHQLHRPRSSTPSSSLSHLYSRPHGSSPLTAIGHHVSSRHVHTTRDSPPGNHATALSFEYAPGMGHDASGKHRAALDALLAALRQADILKLYFCLLDLTRGTSEHDPDFCRIVQSMPATTFSEIIRCFDPINISKHVDSAPGLAISYGAALFTSLGELVNKWGVKTLYLQIFNRLRLVQRARRLTIDHRFRPLLNDYAVLLRCAGAISDVGAAKLIWYEMKKDGYAAWNHRHYTDFLKTRYLTERLYTNNDLARLRLRPLDMHRSSIHLDPTTAKRLKHMAVNLTRIRPHRFGQNVNEQYFAEPQSRMLRTRKPLRLLERKLFSRRLIPGDEQLICAILKANGRMGRMQESMKLLRSCWDILIVKDKESGDYQIGGGADFPPNSARSPTEALLDAVVTCFANMGEIDLAVRLVDFISRRYSIPVPDGVWSDLLDFARIMQTKSAATEWRIARFLNKIASADTILGIWAICTQEPYNFTPGMKDYYNLTKCLIGSHRSLDRPLEALRHIKPLYDEAARQMQDAWLELILTTRQGVSNHAAYHSYRVAQSRKSYMWYCIHYTTTQMLKCVSPGRLDDYNVVRHIPNMIKEFGPFMRLDVEYLTATGKVTLRNDATQLKPIEITQLVDQPRPLTDRPAYVNLERDREDENELGLEEEEEVDRHAIDELLEPSGSSYDAFEESRTHKTSPMAGSRADETEGSDGTLSGDSAPHLDDDWEEQGARVVTRSNVLQLVDRPAILFRPLYSSRDYTSRNGEPTLEALRREGKVFTGYHDDPRKVEFAAHRVSRSSLRGAAVPADLHKDVSRTKLLEHILWMRA